MSRDEIIKKLAELAEEIAPVGSMLQVNHYVASMLYVIAGIVQLSAERQLAHMLSDFFSKFTGRDVQYEEWISNG